MGYVVKKVPKEGVEEDAEKYFLLKKSGRSQKDVKAQSGRVIDLKKKRSQDMDLRAGITESFNEKCAAELFSIMKQRPGYLPKFILIKSAFSEEKIHNKLKKGTAAHKVYVASEIIGDYRDINDQSKFGNNARIFAKPSSHPEQLAALTGDICENAVIMILLSNYDIKIDNFVHRGTSLVPIDFGCARREEDSPDVMSGIDMIRRDDGAKETSSAYSSRRMQNALSKGEGYVNTQRFYSKRLRPEHFLAVIEKIKADAGIESKLRNAVHKWTFGTEEEKQKYASILVARVVNLLKLEPVLLSLQADAEDFPNINLREELAESDEFQTELLTTNFSKGKEFFRFIDDLFREIEEQESAIIEQLEQYGKCTNDEERNALKAAIFQKVSAFNQSLPIQEIAARDALLALQDYYQESEYLSRGDSGEGSWQGYKDLIHARIGETIGILREPLLSDHDSDEDEDWLSPKKEDREQDNSDEDEFLANVLSVSNLGIGASVSAAAAAAVESSVEESSSSQSSEESSNEEVSSSRSSEDEKSNNNSRATAAMPILQRDVSDQIAEWDLSAWRKYHERMIESKGYTTESRDVIKGDTRRLLTHLSAYDTLIGVREGDLSIAQQVALSGHAADAAVGPTTVPSATLRSGATASQLSLSHSAGRSSSSSSSSSSHSTY